MSALVAEARTIVRQGVVGQPVIEEWLEGFKQEPDEGKRVIGLALIQEAPAPGRFFDAALNALSHSRTAFEQYQACSPSIAWSPSLIRTSKPSLRPPWRISEAVGRASTSRQKPTAGRSVAGSLPSSDPTDKLCRRGRELNASRRPTEGPGSAQTPMQRSAWAGVTTRRRRQSMRTPGCGCTRPTFGTTI